MNKNIEKKKEHPSLRGTLIIKKPKEEKKAED